MRSTSATKILFSTLRVWTDQVEQTGPWGVGYSGGRDSTVLLWALAQLSGAGVVEALHVDHGLRSDEERFQELRLVEAQCSAWNIRLHTFGPPEAFGRSEAQAREHRFRCFRQFVDRNPGALVWLAHHADDQAETILMRLLKGHSWQGLGAMVPRRGPYLRPLLGLRSSLLAEVAAEQGLDFHFDSTNGSIDYTRNYLRNRVFPVVLERFPGAVEALNDFGKVWRSLAPQVLVSESWRLGAGTARLASEVWNRWSSLERQGQLMAVTEALGYKVSLTRRFLERVAAAHGAVQGAGWSWSHQGAEVLWQRVVQPSAKEYFIQVEWERTYEVGGWTLRWSRQPGPNAWPVSTLDPDLPLVCRSSQPGMRYRSVDDPDWGKSRRRHRLGGGEGTLLCFQSGLLRLVLGVETGKVLWAENPQGKLQKGQIFVTLTKRSEYER